MRDRLLSPAICASSSTPLQQALSSLPAHTNVCTAAEPMHLGVVITLAALCLWQPQPRPSRTASLRRAASPLLCTDASSSDWRRRDLLQVAAVSALTAGGLSVGPPAFAAETVPQIDALVWRPAAAGTGSATPGCSAASAGTAFGPKFVNYLARFLLSYDVPSRRLWRARAAEIPLAWNKKQVGRAHHRTPTSAEAT